MANVNITRAGITAQKKGGAKMVFHLNDALLDEQGLSIATQNLLVANLPPHCVVTAAYVNVVAKADAATAATVTVGKTEGGAQILAATDIKTEGVSGDIEGAFDTGTGTPVYVKLTATGASTTVGDVYIVLDYDELEVNTGTYTQYS